MRHRSELSQFIKYHSLGNDLILVDWRHQSLDEVCEHIAVPAWGDDVARMCQRHFGIGADGLLVLSKSPHDSIPEVFVFNADGSRAETCFNGLRCVADYLFRRCGSSGRVDIIMGGRCCVCQKIGDDIVTAVGKAICSGSRTIHVAQKALEGHVVSVGNPHFVILGKTTPRWLSLHGKAIERHELFPRRTNVEFVWKPIESMSCYRVLVHERGCGMTLACSSGVAAITGVLGAQGRISALQQTTYSLPGGQLVSWIDAEG